VRGAELIAAVTLERRIDERSFECLDLGVEVPFNGGGWLVCGEEAQVRRGDSLPAGEFRSISGALYDPFKLAHISGPAVLREEFKHCVIDAEDIELLPSGESGDEVSHEKWDIVESFAERGEPDNGMSDPMHQVGAKLSELERLFEGPIRGGDKPKVRTNLAGRTNRAEPLVLKNTEERDLNLRGQLVDLIEKQGSSIGLGDEAPSIGARAGKCPLEVTEEIALNDVGGGEGRLISYEVPPPARAAEVDSPGGETFAGAGFSYEENRLGSLSCGADLGEYAAHRRRFTDESHLLR
jgi:hypothetical protein